MNVEIYTGASDRVRDAKYDHDRTAKLLIEKAKWAIRDLEATIREAERAIEGERYIINSLGVLQGNGVQIDVLCGQLAVRREQYLAALIADTNDDEPESGE